MGRAQRTPSYPHRRADRLGKNARGVPDGARRARAGRLAGAAARRSPRRVRVTAQGVERGHPQESGRAAPGHSPHRRRDGDGAATHHGRGAHRRHAAGRARRDAAQAAAHPGDDAGVAVSAADRRAQPRDAAIRTHRDRRRNSRRDRHSPRRPPGAVARTAATGHRSGTAADWTVGHAETDRRSGPVPRRQSRSGARLRRHRRRASAPDGRRHSRCPTRRSKR